MIISDESKQFLIKHVKEAIDYIDTEYVGDLLAILEDVLIEDEIKNDGLSDVGLELQDIYDEIDESNPM